MAAERKIRPPKTATFRELFRLTDEGEWIADDGQPGIAFYGYITSEVDYAGRPFFYPVAFSYGTARTISTPDVHQEAMDACCDKYRCANGRYVDGRGRWS